MIEFRKISLFLKNNKILSTACIPSDIDGLPSHLLTLRILIMKCTLRHNLSVFQRNCLEISETYNLLLKGLHDY